MEDNERIASKIEAGPLRRLEVLSRWMSAMGVDKPLCRLLDESLEDLRDILLRLKASGGALTPLTEYHVAGWQEVPDPVAVPGQDVPESDRKSSLVTLEMGNRPTGGSFGVPYRAGSRQEPKPGQARLPRLAQEYVDVLPADPGQTAKDRRTHREPALRKPIGEHRVRKRHGKSRTEILRAALREAKADHARALARARTATRATSPRMLDAELDFLIEHTLSKLTAP